MSSDYESIWFFTISIFILIVLSINFPLFGYFVISFVLAVILNRIL